MPLLGPYQIPNVHVTARTVYTNNTPSGAFRGFGGPQGHFAAEMQVNKLAEALGIDPVELRMRNLWRKATLPTKSPCPRAAPSGSAHRRPPTRRLSARTRRRDGKRAKKQRPSTLVHFAALARRSLAGRNAARARRGGLLQECRLQPGRPNTAAWVELHGTQEIEHAVVGCVGAEVGQGRTHRFRQFAAGAGSRTRRVEVRSRSTEVAGSSGSASASRMSFMAGNAIKGAAAGAGEWQNEERPARADFVFRPRPTTRLQPETGAATPTSPTATARRSPKSRSISTPAMSA
jgi:CO/xanthine dehydrogenase Mo-binding subunit